MHVLVVFHISTKGIYIPHQCLEPITAWKGSPLYEIDWYSKEEDCAHPASSKPHKKERSTKLLVGGCVGAFGGLGGAYPGCRN